MATKEITFDGKNFIIGGKTIPVAAAPKRPAPGKATGGGTLSGDEWLPWVLGGGGALLAHSITSPMFDASDEEKRKESVWTKLLRALIPLGVGGLGGVAGYALGNALNKNVKAKPAAQKAAEAAPAAPVVTNVLPHAVNVFKDSRGNPRIVVDGVSEDEYNSWIGRYRTNDPEKQLQMHGDTVSTYGHLSDYGGKAIMGLSALGGVAGILWPWLKEPKTLSSVELRQTNDILDDLYTKRNTYKASLQRAKSGRKTARRAGNTTAIARNKRAIGTARENIRATNKKIRAAESKFSLNKFMRSLRNAGIGSAFFEGGRQIDRYGDVLGRRVLQLNNLENAQLEVNNALQNTVDTYPPDSQPAQPTQPQK